MPSNREIRPDIDEIEISLFGAGFGECLLIHLGQGNWVVIDSCKERRSGRPVALNYLNKIGVNPTDAVLMVAATHWHDDHIRGLAEIFGECVNAMFVCSVAQTVEELLMLAYLQDDNRMMGKVSSGVNELRQIMRIIETHPERRQQWASELKRIIGISDPGAFEVKIYSLAPSDELITDAKKKIALVLNEYVNGTQGAIPSSDLNLFTTVLYIQIGNFSALIGGDLEKTNSLRSGWSRIVQVAQENSDILRKSIAYKVAHHGSANADIPEIWTELLVEDPFAVLTPWNRGGRWLPTLNDIERISTMTPNAFITSRPASVKSKSRGAAVERSLKESGLSLHIAEKSYGHIRIRWLKGALADPRIDLFGAAKKLDDISVS